LPSSQPKLRENTLFIDQPACSNFALHVINFESVDVHVEYMNVDETSKFNELVVSGFYSF